MASEKTTSRLIGCVVASLLVHALTAGVLPTGIRASTPIVTDMVSEIAFDVVEPLPVVEPEPPIAPVEPPPVPVAVRPDIDPDPRPSPPSDRVDSSAVAAVTPTQTPGATEPSSGEPGPEAPAEAPITVREGLRIDPRAAALGATYAGPRIPAPQASDGPGPESAEAQSARLSEQHSNFLAAVGNRRDYITRREPPALRRRPDGSYVFNGSAFSARILPDGTVQFSDRNNVRFADFGGPSDSLGATVRFDITDAAERRAGNDPYRAERRWFLEETESLRERLGTEHRVGVSATEQRGLRGSLERVWADAAKPAASRRAALFRIWDDLAEDETGAPMRRTVLTFVRTRLPAGSVDAFSADELARLNGRRQSGETFAPY